MTALDDVMDAKNTLVHKEKRDEAKIDASREVTRPRAGNVRVITLPFPI